MPENTITTNPEPNVVFTKQQPPTPPAEEKPEAEGKQQTPEELEAATKAVMEGLGLTYTPKAKEEKAQETPPPVEEKKPEGDEKKPEPKEEPKEEPKAKPKSLNPDELAANVAEKVTKALAPKQEAPTPETPTPEVSDTDKRTRAVFEVLAEKPDYKGIVQQFDDFLVREKEYRARWEKAHPGKTYNPDDGEHSAFYDKHEPTCEPDDYTRAEAKLEAREEVTKKFEETERKRRVQEISERVIKRVEEVEKNAVKDLAKEVDPELAKVDDLSKLAETDPFADLALRTVTRPLQILSAEVEKLWGAAEIGYTADPNNPVHQDLLARILAYENQLLNGPEKDQVLSGRKLIPIEEYNKLKPDQRRDVWSIWLAPEKIRELLVRDFAGEAKKQLTTLRHAASKYTTGASPSPAGAPGKDSGPKSGEAAPASRKPQYPNTVGGGEKVTGGATPPPANGDMPQLITNALFGA